jgi:hypothetical protein
MAKDNAGGSSFLASLRGGILIREHPRKSAVEPSDHRSDEPAFLPFLRASVVGSLSQTKTAAQVRAAVLPTKERPQSALEKIFLLHVHVFRQAIELTCRVPRLDYQDVSAFGSGDRLVKSRAGRRAHLYAIDVSFYGRDRCRVVLDTGIHPKGGLHIVTIIRSRLINPGVAYIALRRIS